LLAGLGVSVPSARMPFARVQLFVPPLIIAAREIAAACDA